MSQSVHVFTGLLVCLSLLAGIYLVPVQANRRKWQNLRQTAMGDGNDGRLECGSQFHDIQSKWLQSAVVLHIVTWQQAETRSARSHRFNITAVVQSVLKSAQTESATKISPGSRITVGEFSGALSRRQRTRQRQQCTPSRLKENDKGYIFFLAPTRDPAYFRHSFLPIKFRPHSLKKFRRVSCTSPRRCPEAPLIVKAIPQGVTPLRDSRDVSMRFVCAATGEPTPVVRWLKDGAELILTDRIRAQYKRRPHEMASRLTVRPVRTDDAGNYTCLFTNLQGTVNATFQIGANHSSIAWTRLLSHVVSLYTIQLTSGSDNEGFQTVWRQVAEILNAGGERLKKKLEMPAYVCDASNETHCMNGGTCIINTWDGSPHCVCPSNFTGRICEKFDK